MLTSLFEKLEFVQESKRCFIMDKKITYHEEVSRENTRKLREVLATLPGFAKDYFRAIEPNSSAKTRISYVYDIRVFFSFLCSSNPYFNKYDDVTKITLSDLEQLQPVDIEEYLEYLSYYEKEDKIYTNDERGKKRKLAALRSFYSYFFEAELIQKNPAVLVPLPKLHEKEIVRLDADEVAVLLDQVEDGTNLTKAQQRFHQVTKTRDIALLTLLLGTGIRVSECVGLDLEDVDFKNNGIKIRRKGGYEAVIYFGEEVEEALTDYLEERHHIIPQTGHEHALFLSMQQRRMSVRAVENMVKKYASTVTSLKKITPHKLRSTYGTSLYRETGDIYLVADVLGHKDVNTTKKHYAALEDERRRSAADKVRLREKPFKKEP